MLFLLRHLTSEFNSSETTTNNHNFISVFPREYMVLPTFFVTNLKSADIDGGKRGNTTLALPGHDPSFEITIFNDIALNPGPATNAENRVQPGHQVMIEHRSENLLRAPILTYSRQQLVNLRRQRCFPSSPAITLLKQCGIFKFRGRKEGRYRKIQRHYANFSVCRGPLFHRAVNLDN